MKMRVPSTNVFQDALVLQHPQIRGHKHRDLKHGNFHLTHLIVTKVIDFGQPGLLADQEHIDSREPKNDVTPDYLARLRSEAEAIITGARPMGE